MGTRKNIAHGATRSLSILAGLIAVTVAEPAWSQEATHRANPETTARERQAQDAPVEVGMKRMSKFGTQLSDTEAVALLREMQQMAQQALEASRAAERAGSVAEVKSSVEQVFQTVWGHPSGVAAAGAGAVQELGWKERWQVTGGEFDPNFVKRLGAQPPTITDPRRLGIVGRGRAVRGHLEEISRSSGRVIASQATPADRVLASLNNVIGWTYITTGFKGREVQPRISFTHIWDAPTQFWNTTADTGWMEEVHAQAVNILKTEYQDVAEARRHAAGLSELLQKVLAGVDADKNGNVEAKPMEGGLNVALEVASRTSLRAE